MGKTLFIAEKAKIASELLKSPRFKGAKKRVGSKPYYGYFENENYIISWCRGHLLELKFPEEIDLKYKEFKFDQLPLILQPEYKIKKENEEQLTILVELLKRSDIDHIVNACDKDKEGELIYREVYEYAGIQKKQSRLFISSYESAELEAELNRLLPGKDFDSLAAAAKARQYLDYMIGVNITRGCTTKLANNNFRLSSGRVQMCILNEIYQRELAIKNYKEQNFYNLKLVTSLGFTAVMKNEEQLLDQSPLIQLGNRIKDTQLIVKEFEEKNRKKKAKALYNLTDLYKDALTKLKISAESAKKHIQSLYEEGFISYPRSSSRHLPTEKVDRVKEVLEVFRETDYAELIQSVDISSITKKHSTFNNELVNSHFAIIPTTKKYNNANKNPLEQKLYDLIVKRFIGNFMPAAVYLVREVHLLDQEGNEYIAKEKILKEKGFLSVFQEDVEEGSVDEFKIPVLSENDNLLVSHYDLVESKTKKPPLHTESSILTFMETAGRKIDDEHLKALMKGKRIGTVATEEAYIPKLEDKGYILLENGKINVTDIGRAFIQAFPIQEIKNPEYTAEMEGMITDIEENLLTYEEFVAKTNSFLEKMIEQLATVDEKIAKRIVSTWTTQIEICSCLCGKGKMIDKGKFYGCSCYPDCEITFPKKIKEKTIPREQVKKLFENKKTNLLKGFKSDDKDFDAYIVFHNGKFQLQFPTIEELSLGKCPKCRKGEILDKESFYGCSNYKNGCNFTIPAKIKEKSIPESQIKKLIGKDRTTDFIKGFISEKGEFTAAICLKDNKLQFKFPTIEELSLGKCPKCRKGEILDKESFYGCSNYKNGCDFTIPAEIKEKSIPGSQIKKLIGKDRTTDFIKGFISEKGEFTAAICLKDNKLQFKFPTIEELSLGKCPKCRKGEILDKESFYGCSNYKNGCDFTIPAEIKGKSIPGSQIKKLIGKNRTTDFIKGFISEKGEYTAAIYLKDNKLQFKFPTIEDRTLGKCPLCRDRVLIGKTTYLCVNYKKKCDFILPSEFLGKKITSNHVKKLLEKNLTDVIKDFESKNEPGKKFDARLSYDTSKKRLSCISEKKSKGTN
ncbi:DNA topoisomerase [Bacillus cereus]|nr:DNA topoisomerase [Bacillus cereus]MEC3260695.1 DNA topoisomerase [Bacillus cereus]